MKTLAVTLLSILAMAAEYDYSQNGDNWDGLCKTGESQSPVVIPAALGNLPVETLNKIANGTVLEATFMPMATPTEEFEVQWIPTEVVINGDDLAARNKVILPDGTIIYLDHVHFHAAAEHPISSDTDPESIGTRGAAEAHFVYKDDTGAAHSVFGYIFELQDGAPDNELFKRLKFKDNITWDTANGSYNVSIKVPWGGLHYMIRSEDFDSFGNTLPYITYPGSLTTPPCTEGVTFYLAKIPMSEQDAKIFEPIVNRLDGRGSYRNVQPLNGRSLKVVQMRMDSNSAASAVAGAAGLVALSALLA